MTLSIRNQLPGTVTEVRRGEVMATVEVRLTGGQNLTAAITMEPSSNWASPRAHRCTPW